MQNVLMVTSANHQRLAQLVKSRREELRLSMEKAAERGSINRLTWRAVETGNSVRNSTHVGVEDALEWERGSIAAILDGGEPTLREEAQAQAKVNLMDAVEKVRIVTRLLATVREEYGEEIYQAAAAEVQRRLGDQHPKND